MCGWSGLFSCVVDLQCTEAKSPSVVGTKTENDFKMEDLKSRTSEDLEPGILRRISRPYHRRLVTILYLTFFLWPLSSVNICPHYEIWWIKNWKKIFFKSVHFFPQPDPTRVHFFPHLLFSFSVLHAHSATFYGLKLVHSIANYCSLSSFSFGQAR